MEKDKLKDLSDLQTDFSPPTSEDWRAAVDKLLKGAPYDKIMPTHTYEGITLEPMYRKEDCTEVPYLDSRPGEAPFVRGTHRLGYLEKKREIAQEIRYTDPAQFNQALRADLQAGQTAVTLVPDAATRAGVDSDADSGTGQGGVAISTVQDLQTALQDVDLSTFPLHIACGESGLAMAGLLAAFCRKNNFDLKKMQGSLSADPLAVLLETGTLRASLTTNLDSLAQLTRWGENEAPHLATIGVDVSPVLNAGGSAVQELGLALANGVFYLRQLLDRGLAIDSVASRMRFTFAVGGNFFMEIAKFRAARMLWSRVVQAFGGDENAQKMHVHAKTAIWNKTLFDPYVNMLRTTTEAFSAALAGVDSLHVGPFDEAIREADDFSLRIARNQQIVLDEESHLTQVVDPAGGSWYVENLTHELSEKAWVFFQKIEEKGGAFACLQAGFVQEEIAAVAAQKRENLSRRKDRLVGTTFYANPTEDILQARETDLQKLTTERKKSLKKWREDHPQVQLNADATIDEIIAAAEKGTTLGAINRAIATAGAGESIAPLKFERLAEPFEKLRLAMHAFKEKNGAAVKVFLANMGPVAQHKARADFAAGFFQIAGFEVESPAGFEAVDAAVEAAKASNAAAVVLCSSDKTYPDLVPAFCEKMRRAAPQATLVLAGYPKAHLEAFRAAGIDEFIHVRANALAILTGLMQKTGVIK